MPRPNVLIVLLEYIDLFNLKGNMKQIFGRGYPALYHSLLLYFILSITIVTNKHILLKFAPIICQHFAICFCHPIILIILPAKSTHP